MSLEIKENELLSKHSTFRIGGPARYFIFAKNQEELSEAISFAKEKDLPYFVLGGGSNILFRDEGYDGVVIRLKNIECGVQDRRVVSGGGVPLGRVIMEAVECSLNGLEWGAGIPGTVGGGVAGNCGAYGHSISEVVVSVDVLTEDGEIKTYLKEECQFGYRTSRFKEKDNKEIILWVNLQLQDGDKELSKQEVKKNLMDRKTKIPPYPSAGSVLKNLIIDELENKEEFLKMIPPEKIRGGKIGTGYLIEQCYLKGKVVGGAQISDLHANFIINLGSATAKDVLKLIDICKEEVKKKFGIDLEEEILIV